MRSLPQQVSPSLVDHLYDLLGPVAKGKAPMELAIEYDSQWLEDPREYLSSLWCPLHHAFQRNKQFLGHYQAMAWLATLSYAADHDKQLVLALLSLTFSPAVAATALPSGASFLLSEGYGVKKDQLRTQILAAAIPFDQCPERGLAALPGESGKATLKRRRRIYQENMNHAATSFQDHLALQWPCASPRRPEDSTLGTYFYVSQAMSLAAQKWAIWHANLLFRQYLESFVFGKLGIIPVESVSVQPAFGSVRALPHSRKRGFVSVEEAFSNAAPVIAPADAPELDRFVQIKTVSDTPHNNLSCMLSSLESMASFGHERQYLAELNRSLLSLRRHVVRQLDQDFWQSALRLSKSTWRFARGKWKASIPRCLGPSAWPLRTLAARPGRYTPSLSTQSAT